MQLVLPCLVPLLHFGHTCLQPRKLAQPLQFYVACRVKVVCVCCVTLVRYCASSRANSPLPRCQVISDPSQCRASLGTPLTPEPTTWANRPTLAKVEHCIHVHLMNDRTVRKPTGTTQRHPAAVVLTGSLLAASASPASVSTRRCSASARRASASRSAWRSSRSARSVLSSTPMRSCKCKRIDEWRVCADVCKGTSFGACVPLAHMQLRQEQPWVRFDSPRRRHIRWHAACCSAIRRQRCA